MRKMISAVKAAVMSLTLVVAGYCGGGQSMVQAKENAELVLNPMAVEDQSYKMTSDSVYIQDLVDYCNGELSYGSASTSGNYSVRKYNGSGSDLSIVQSYVETICNGNYNLALTEEYNESYSSTFFSWGIDYTGAGDVYSTTKVNYTDSVCTIGIYGMIERDRMEMAIWIPLEMDQVDLGLRYGGQNVSVGIGGGSASAGLYKLPDGSFETTDGRFSVKPGQAVVLRDGETYTTEATFNRDSNIGRDELWVRNFYRDETIYFCAPESRLMTGDIYIMKDLLQDPRMLQYMRTADDFDDFIWTLFFGAGHDGSFIMPVEGDSNRFKDLIVRVMYWEKDVQAVYYIYAEFLTSPYTVEALCAVDLNGGQSAVQADGEYTLYTGESLDITCPTEYDTNYELFTWEIVEGSSLAEVAGTISRTCTVKANRPGTVRVKVTYEYGIDEPDVLTGFARNSDKSKTMEYLIHIDQK